MAERRAAGKHEVTFEEWDVCLAGGGRGGWRPTDPAWPHVEEDWGRGRRPVMWVSWPQAQDYARWLTETTGASYRLLTEAEWEYAARAGATGRFSWGEAEPVCDPAAPNGASFRGCAERRTREVGSFPANAFGLHDMHGNLREWVQDCHRDDYAGAPTDGSAVEGPCAKRVMRGGDWNTSSPTLDAARRSAEYPSTIDRIGFRVARDLAPAVSPR